MDKRLLHKYLNGDNLTEKELQQVEQAVENNPNLLAEAERIINSNKPNPELLGKTKLILRERDRQRLKNKLQGIEKELEEEKKISTSQIRGIRRWRIPISIAAMAIFTLGALWFYNNSNKIDYEQLATMYDSPYPTDNIELEKQGAAFNDKEKQQVMMGELMGIFANDKATYLEKTDEYQGNLPMFDREITLLKGIAYREVGDIENAKETLKSLGSESNDFQDDAQWQLAMIYISEKDSGKAKEWLAKIPKDSKHYQKAQELFSKL